jgi:hypothetical protein
MHNSGRRSLRALSPRSPCLSLAGGGAAAAAIEPFALPGGLSPRDDGSLAAIPIGFPINFFGVTHTQLVINNRRHSLVGNTLPNGDESIPLGRYQFVVRNGAIAQGRSYDDGDKLGFEFVVRNGGQLESNAHPLSL